MANELPLTEFDRITLNQTLQIFKAMIPFLDYPLQRTLSLFIRMNELKQTMQFYSSPQNLSSFSTCNFNGSRQTIHSINDLLKNEQAIDTILKYCPEQYASMLRSYRQFSRMSDLFNMMNIMNGGDFTSGFDPGSINPNMFSGAGINPDMFSGSGMNPADLLSKFFTGEPTAANPQENTPPPSESDAPADENASQPSAPPASEPPPASAPPTGNVFLNNFMNPKQQQLYNDYITQLDQLDFEKQS